MASVYSIADDDSNIDLAALDSDDLQSNQTQDTNTLSDDDISPSDSITSSYNVNQVRTNPFDNPIINVVDDSSRTNLATTNTYNSNYVSLITTDSSSNLHSVRRNNGTLSNYANDIDAIDHDDDSEESTDNERDGDQNDVYSDDDYNQDIVSNVGVGDDDNDSYSFDYISNHKIKLGDKLKTAWPNAMKNEREYKDLQIIDEVEKLQNLNFFSKNYIENLESLKVSQLGLLIEMVKLTDNSFDEFYGIWNNFHAKFMNENNIKTDIDERNMKNDDADKSSVSNSSYKSNNTNITNNDESNKSDQNSIKHNDNSSRGDKSSRNDATSSMNIDNDEDYEKEMEMVTWFNINESEGFKLMEKRKMDILNDLDKINDSIDQIDSFTKSMWTKY